jgi:hypothetical protein
MRPEWHALYAEAAAPGGEHDRVLLRPRVAEAEAELGDVATIRKVRAPRPRARSSVRGGAPGGAAVRNPNRPAVHGVSSTCHTPNRAGQVLPEVDATHARRLLAEHGGSLRDAVTAALLAGTHASAGRARI